MSVRLFVGNLPYDTTEGELREFLSAVGPLASVYLPINRDTGKPRGFAFVEFGQSQHAQEAIGRFNNQPFKGRNLSISEARARESRPPDDGRGRDMRGPMSRPPMGASPLSRPPRLERSSPPADMDAPRAARGRSPERKRTGRRQADFAARTERGPKKPIREKPGGRLYDDFDDENLPGVEEELIEDDFSRRADEEGEEQE